MPNSYYCGEIVSDGTSGANNAIARSVNRRLTGTVNGPVHRCNFQTEIEMPAFTIPVNPAWPAFSGVEWYFGYNATNLGSYTFTDSGPVERIRGGKKTEEVPDWSPSYTTIKTAEYALALEMVDGERVWMLQRCVYDGDFADSDTFPFIHSAWTAPWRTVYNAWNATHGTLIFAPMSRGGYIAWWRGATHRGSADYSALPSPPASGDIEDYHLWLDPAGSLTCAVDIVA